LSTVTGNGALKYPIGLITADELQMAGQLNYNLSYTDEAWTTNTNFYYWSLSPNDTYNVGAFVFNAGVGGDLSFDYVDYEGAVRPVVSLSSETLISKGDGSTDNPYVVS